MKIDTDHLHFWMQAIRQSSNPIRTMDAFWSGQLKSKEWLITNLQEYINESVSIDIHGGWVGVLASLLFQSRIVCSHINSIDIDADCEPVAVMMNKGEEMAGKFNAITSDMCNFNSVADVIINTSCEHITQDRYNTWISAVPKSSLIVVQSNDYAIPEHIRTAKSLSEFKDQSQLNVCWAGELQLPLYKRFMIIGRS